MWGLTSQPIRHSDKYWREFAQRSSYSEVHKSDREQLISTSTASFTRLSDPYSDKNPSLFLPSLAGLVIFLL